jgi:hypothetical protein
VLLRQSLHQYFLSHSAHPRLAEIEVDEGFIMKLAGQGASCRTWRGLIAVNAENTSIF